MPRSKSSTHKSSASGNSSASGSQRHPPVPKRRGPSNSKTTTKPVEQQSRQEKRDGLSLPTLVASSLRDQSFVKLILSQPILESTTSKVTVRPIEIGGQTMYQWA